MSLLHIPRSNDTKLSVKFFDNLITFEELLAMLKHQYSKPTIYRWVQRQGMPHKRIKGKLWFPKTDVIHWLERS
jgi:excisionase family DNA binding protein